MFAWRIPWTEEPGGLPTHQVVHGVERVGQDSRNFAHGSWIFSLIRNPQTVST